MKSIVLVSLIVASLSLSAQDTLHKMHTMNKKNFSAWVSRSLGVSFQQFDNLNSRISGLPQEALALRLRNNPTRAPAIERR